MNLPVGDVIELVRPEKAALLGQALRHLVVIAGILVRLFRDDDDLGAERAEQFHLCRRLVIGNDDDGAIAPRLAHHGESDAGVAAVPSMMVAPGRNRPALSAASMMPSAARSFTEPPGFMNSALPRISLPVSSERRRSRM